MLPTRLALILALAATSPAHADVTEVVNPAPAATDSMLPQTSPTATTAPGTLSPQTVAVLASVGAGTAALAFGAGTWWLGEDLVPFHLRSTGWFQHYTYSGGSDKVGHFLASYLGVIILTNMYDSIGLRHGQSAALATGLSFVVGNAVEFFDAITHFGFEYEDSIANALGTAAGVTAMLLPEFHNAVGFRIGIVPSEHFAETGPRIRKVWGLQKKMRLINDYSGQTYYADLKVKGIAELFGIDANAANYLLVGVNYGTRDYETTLDKRYSEYMKSRLVGAHIGVNLPELLRDNLPRSTGRGVLESFTRYYAVPLTTIQVVRDIEHRTTFVRFALQSQFELP